MAVLTLLLQLARNTMHTTTTQSQYPAGQADNWIWEDPEDLGGSGGGFYSRNILQHLFRISLIQPEMVLSVF